MKRANIESQPRIVRELLNKAIESEGFGNYEKLAQEFKRFGRGFSKSGIHRYGVKLQQFQAAARAQAEMMSSFGATTRWLITWARSYPGDANRLVARLQRQQDGFKKGRK